MDESFGARMRQRRERQQIPLTAIAEQTKIKLSLLEAMERDDVSRWPSGIFRRAFIRAYAHAIGLDPDVVVREFLERHPDPVEEVGLASIVVARDPDAVVPGDGPPTRFRQLIGAAVDALHLRWGTIERSHSIEDLTAGDRASLKTVPQSEPHLLAAARLCTELAQVSEVRDAASLLERAVTILDAVGLIVWVWDPQKTELTPALAHGYSDKVLAQLPKVRRDDDHATAAAFRSAQTSIVNGSPLISGALVVPLMTRAGCVGVLAIELRNDRLQRESVHALATIFAAQLARLVEVTQPARAVDRKLA